MTITFNADDPGKEHRTDLGESDGLFDAEFKPLTVDEARQWRALNPATSPWWVVVWQALAGVFFALMVGLSVGVGAGISAAYGATSVVLPAAIMVRGLLRQREVASPGAAMLGFVVWESVKIALTVAMLILAPKLVQPLSWLALVAGFVVTMKVYWVAAWLHSRRRNLNVSN